MAEYDNVAKALGLEKAGAEGILEYLSGQIDHKRGALEKLNERIERGKRTYFIIEKRKKHFMNERENSDPRGDEYDHFDKIYDGLFVRSHEKMDSVAELENERRNLYKVDFNFE